MAEPVSHDFATSLDIGKTLEKALSRISDSLEAEAASLFMISLIATFALLHLLGAVAFGRGERRQVVRAMIAMTLTVVLMSGTVRRVRHLGAPANAVDNAEATLDEGGDR